MTPAQADALLVVARKYHAGLLLRLAAGGAAEWVRAECYRVGLLLDSIDNPPTPAPPGMFDNAGRVR